jgi:anti-sigma-K factor RskA
MPASARASCSPSARAVSQRAGNTARAAGYGQDLIRGSGGSRPDRRTEAVTNQSGALAAEYALGTLGVHGGASSATKATRLRRLVALAGAPAPLDIAARRLCPAASVAGIEQRFPAANSDAAGSRDSGTAGFWRGATQGRDGCCAGRPDPGASRETMVVAMSDDRRPGHGVLARERGERGLRARDRPSDHGLGTAWELWMIPPGCNPVSTDQHPQTQS